MRPEVVFAAAAVLIAGCAGSGARPAAREDPRVMPALKFNRNVVEMPGGASYDVFGTTAEAIRASLDANVPTLDGRRVLGSHTYWISYSYTTKTSMMRCKPLVKFTVTSTTTLPKWKDRDKADSSLRAQWDLFMAQLTRHERGHRAIAIKNVDLMERRITALEPPTCQELTLLTRNIFNDVMNQMRQQQADWDADPANKSSWLVPGGRNPGATMRPLTSAPTDLSGSSWRVIELRVAGEAVADPTSQQTISFAVDTLRISGNLGCTRFTAAYLAGDGGAIRFSPIGPRVDCADPALNRPQAMFAGALAGANQYRISGDSLSLLRDEAILARLLRRR